MSEYLPDRMIMEALGYEKDTEFEPFNLSSYGWAQTDYLREFETDSIGKEACDNVRCVKLPATQDLKLTSLESVDNLFSSMFRVGQYASAYAGCSVYPIYVF